MEVFDSDDCTAYGVIGGGIKSLMLYKIYPSAFPSRSRNALWSMWYLSKKKVFDCKSDSEFLMIDLNKSITQQNYFYPYELFSYYAYEIYKLLNAEAEKMNVGITPGYRYVIVDSFFDYVAGEHQSEITLLTSQVKENDGGSYA